MSNTTHAGSRSLRMFARSLRNHPGLAMCWASPALGLLAAVMHSPKEHLAERAAVSMLVLGLCAWIPVLVTAWTGRLQYEDKEAS